MKIKDARINFFVNDEYTTIELIDNDASVVFAKVVLTPHQLSRAFSRGAYTNCEIDVFGIEKIGKTHENKDFVFEISNIGKYNNKVDDLVLLCIAELKLQGMEEWVPDGYFSSQNSFFSKDGKNYARATIRRWI